MLGPCAGLLGAGGIAISAAAAHLDGGGPAATAGLFLMVHAAALLALGSGTGEREPGRTALAGVAIAVGTVLFSGELALAGLFGLRPLPIAAPVGGLLMMAGWAVLPLAALSRALTGRLRR